MRRLMGGGGPLYAGKEDSAFQVDGVEFVCDLQTSTPGRFYLLKDPRDIQSFLDLCRQFREGVIVELGIAEGGSAALMALVADPRRLVAIDISEPVEALDQFVEQRGLGDRVRTFYGIDQADRDRVASVVDEATGGEPLDLVIDDASHYIDETRSSFETLFPRLRPGGMYVIEDWNSEHVFRDVMVEHLRSGGPAAREQFQDALRGQAADPESAPPDRLPLSRLGIELMLVRATDTDVIDSVSFTREWIVVRRGAAPLDRDTFRLSDHHSDHFGHLT